LFWLGKGGGERLARRGAHLAVPDTSHLDPADPSAGQRPAGNQWGARVGGDQLPNRYDGGKEDERGRDGMEACALAIAVSSPPPPHTCTLAIAASPQNHRPAPPARWALFFRAPRPSSPRVAADGAAPMGSAPPCLEKAGTKEGLRHLCSLPLALALSRAACPQDVPSATSPAVIAPLPHEKRERRCRRALKAASPACMFVGRPCRVVALLCCHSPAPVRTPSPRPPPATLPTFFPSPPGVGYGGYR